MMLLLIPVGQVVTSSLGDRFFEAYQKAQVDRIEQENRVWKMSVPVPEAEINRWRKQLGLVLGIPENLTKTPLQVERTGSIDTASFRVEKIVFQSRPGLYVTGNLYLPKNLAKPAPAVLYVCGHGNAFEEVVDNEKKIKQSLGSKVYYRNHGARLALMGYVCLVIDTLQLGEIEGTHHGTYNKGMFWWQSMGYTPAGVECLNGMRAIDFLQSLKEVDPNRIGVTGRSGGGASTWWITAMDTRVKCAIGVAGMADLRAHLIAGEQARFNQGVITGHCDCMFMVNSERLDFSRVGQLCAPRPALLINTDQDPIFPLGGFRRPTKEIAEFYKAMGHPERFSVFQGKGGHEDTEELQQAAFDWLETWLNPTHPPRKLAPRFLLEEWTLKVLQTKPKDEKNTTAHDWFWNESQSRKSSDGQNPSHLLEVLNKAVPTRLFGDPKSQITRRKSPVTPKEGILAWDILENEVVVAQLWTKTQPAKSARILLLGEDQESAQLVLLSPSKAAPIDEVLFLPGKGPMLFSDKRLIDQGDYQIRRRVALLGTTVAGVQTRVLLNYLGLLGDNNQVETKLLIKAEKDLALVAACTKALSKGIKPQLQLTDYPKSWKEAPPLLRVGLVAEPEDILLLSESPAIK